MKIQYTYSNQCSIIYRDICIFKDMQRTYQSSCLHGGDGLRVGMGMRGQEGRHTGTLLYLDAVSVTCWGRGDKCDELDDLLL